MEGGVTIRGRLVTAKDIELIRRVAADFRAYGRTRISREVCLAWGWFQASGRTKDMACREVLRRLEAMGLVELPRPITPGRLAGQTKEECEEPELFGPVGVEGLLSEIGPVDVRMVRGTGDERLFRRLVEKHHYLGYRAIVGEHLKYVAFCRKGPLACLGWGGAAWKVACRDEYIGWSAEVRKQKLQWLADNTRFLILPWVRVPHLASYLLGLQARCISEDWERVYGHAVVLLETFVDRERFKGTCYRAANWVCVGQTKGRGKYDVRNEGGEPVKDVYVYPLRRDFRRVLTEREEK